MKLLPTIALSAAIAIWRGCRLRPNAPDHHRHHGPEAGCDGSFRKADARAESCDFQGLLGASRRKESPREGTEKLPRGMHAKRRQTILSGTPPSGQTL